VKVVQRCQWSKRAFFRHFERVRLSVSDLIIAVYYVIGVNLGFGVC
jgi:hypothetical protein